MAAASSATFHEPAGRNTPEPCANFASASAGDRPLAPASMNPFAFHSASLRALCTLGYFASPEVLRTLRLAPFAIDTPVCEADLWYPAIGSPRASIRLTDADRTPPSAGVPLAQGAPLAPGYGETRG